MQYQRETSTHRPAGRLKRFDGDFLRVASWALAVSSGLALIFNLLSGNLPLWPSILFLAALAGMAGAEGALQPSESTKKLLQEHRSGKAGSAHSLHAPASVGPAKAGQAFTRILLLAGFFCLVVAGAWAVLSSVSDPSARLALFLVIPAAALAYGYYRRSSHFIYLSFLGLYGALLLLDLPADVLWYASAVALVGASMAWLRERPWELFWTSVGTFLALGAASADPSADGRIKVAVLVLSLLAVLAFTLPLAFLRRTVEGRHAARGVIAATVLYVFLLPFVIGDGFDYVAWLFSVGICAFAFLGFGAIAWWKHGEYSHAKYYAAGAIGLLLVVALVLPQNAAVQLALIMAGLLTLAIGFSMPSYSARLMGLSAITASLAYYGAFIFPSGALTLWADGSGLSSRVLCGAVLVAALPIVALHYRDADLKGEEARHRSAVIQFLNLASLAILAGLCWAELPLSSAHAAWAAIGIFAALWGGLRRLPMLTAASAGLACIGVLSFLLIDAAGFSVSEQAAALAGTGIACVVAALLLRIPALSDNQSA